ncbi:MAG TPA: YsnF/AvaK domain-containing protein [Vicinamibacterales bacterium]|jgi:uncharacterized protein (TIGR02271 family)
MRNAAVVRDDGTRGSVVGDEDPDRLVVQFDDGSRLDVAREALVRQDDGSYRLSTPSDGAQAVSRELVIPVIAEELTVETHRVDRGRVRVSKRIESHEEVVDTPLVREEVVVERVPINTLVEGEAPAIRDEDGVLIIPLVEEVTVVEKRLLLREEVRVSRHRTTTSTPRTVVLRREVVDIQRDEFDSVEPSTVPPEKPARKE